MSKIYKALLILGIIICIFGIISCQPKKGQNLSLADSTITRMIENHFEEWALKEEGEPFDSTVHRAFAGFELYGSSTSDTLIEAFGCIYYTVYSRKQDQVFDGIGSTGPIIGLIYKNPDGNLVVDKLGGTDPFSDVDITQRFPSKYMNRLLHWDNRSAAIRANSKAVAYWGNFLDNKRFIIKPIPINTRDIHNHTENIYSYLNLKNYYNLVNIIPAKFEEHKNDIPSWSSTTFDGRYVAWNRDGLFFWDVWTDSMFKIVNSVSNEWWAILKERWKDNRTLVFDQVNGYMVREAWGVHIELDIPSKKVIWAVPFGPLGYPKKTELLESIIPAKSVTLQGAVADGTNRSILNNAKVEIQGQGKIITTDREGRFEFKGLPVGQYVLNISQQGYYPRTLKVIATGYETETVNVFLFDSSYGRVEGQVVDAGKRYGIPDIDVGADNYRPRARTDEKGNFVLDGLRPGDYTLRVFPRKGHRQESKKVKLSPGVTVRCEIRTEKFNN